MNLREEFIKSVCEDAPHTFLRYMGLHGSKNEPFDVKELLQTLQRKDHERLWAGLRDMTHRFILNSPAGNQENNGMETDKDPLTMEWPILQSLLKGITTVALCAVAVPENTIHIPPAMLETVAILHGMLVALPDGAETLQNNIAQVCESWFLNELDGKEELVTHTMPYLIIRSLARGTVSDVKRVWSLRQSLLLMDYNDNSSESLSNLLHQCMIHPMYLKLEEGRRFLSFLFGLNPDLSKELHKTIKNQIPSCAINVLRLYGEVYFRAWRVASGPYLKVLEENCVQDLMFCAVHAQRTGSRSMSSRIRKVLEYFHQQKKLRGVDEVLFRLYQPIIWRAFKVANPMVRANAAALLTDAFPLQNPDAGNEEIDSLLQKQFDIIQDLLEDPCPAVRATAVHGVCRITGVFWELIPAHIIKTFITKVVNDLAFDTAASVVRVAVFQGLKFVLDNRLSHPLLKSLLGNLKDLIHDLSEKVRIAFLDVLLMVKGMKAIKYWNIVPLDQLLTQLEVEPSASVTLRLVKLLFNSFHPANKEPDVLMARCASLWQASSLAARKFYQYVHLHTTVSATGKFIILLGQCLLKCAQNGRDDNNSSSEEVNGPVDDKENVESLENVDLFDDRVLSGMAETIAICWGGIRDQLDKSCNEGTTTKLVAKFTKSLPKMFGAFEHPRIQAACIVIAGFLPQSSLPAFSDKCLSSLSSLFVGSATGEYGPLLNCLCAWGRVTEVLVLINEWISCHFTGTKPNHQGKTTRQNKKSVTFQLHPKEKPSLALDFLAWLMGEPVCRTAVQGNSDKLRQIADTLKTVMAVVELKLSSSRGGRPSSLSQSDEEFFKKAFRAYCLSEIHLHHLEKDETNAGATAAMENVIVWADRVLLTPLVTDCDPPGSGLSPATSGTSKQTQEEEDDTLNHLICNFIEMILSSLSEMIMLGIAEEKFYSHVAVFTTSFAKLGWKAGPFLPQLSKLLYQITHSVLLREDPGNHKLLEGPVSVVLTSLLQILTSCATTEDDLLSQAISVVRSSLAEVFLLTEVGRRRTGAAGTLMAPLLCAVLADIKDKTSPAEDETDVFELPRLATFFVKMVSGSQALVRSFVYELERFVLSEKLGKAIKSMLAAVLLLRALQGKAGSSSIKACALHIDKQLKNLDHNNVAEERVALNTARSFLDKLLCRLQIVN